MKNSYFKYIASLLLFGSNGIVASYIKLTSDEIVLLRTLIGSLFLISVFLATKRTPSFHHHKKDLLLIVISGIAMGTSWMFLYEAYAQIGVSISSLLYYCGPVIVMIASPILFREKLSLIKMIGFAAVVLGILLINGNAFKNGGNLFGIFCGIMSAVMYAVMVIANKKSQHITGIENSVLQLISGCMTVALFVGIKNGFAFRIHTNDWMWIFILGVLNTGIGCYFYFSSIERLPVQTVAICGYLESLSAVLFAAIFLSEKMLPLQILGAVLIIGGAVCGECFSVKRKASAKEEGLS